MSKRYWTYRGDSLAVLATLPAGHVDSIVTDPPYELGFMGKGWDKSGIANNVDLWKECFRVLKPGGYLLAFGGTRTYHRMACAVEDAGFEIRDCVGWLYGQGFPKSLNIAQAIDKAQRGAPQGGPDPEKRGTGDVPDRIALAMGGKDGGAPSGLTDNYADYVPQTDDAKKWDGWGTALKPSWEPIIVARKPLDGTVVNNVLTYGTGGLNIDACRIAGEPVPINKLERWTGFGEMERPKYQQTTNNDGRWPANIVHDGSEDVLAIFPDTGKSAGGRIGKKASSSVNNVPTGTYHAGDPGYGDSGSAARFFYCAKVSRREREAGCDHLPAKTAGEVTGGREAHSAGLNSPRAGAGRMSQETRNTHPTVKPIALMRHLVRLVTPPDGVVLDPFMGSGTTGCAAMLEERDFIGIDMTEEYVTIANARLDYWREHDQDFEPVSKPLDMPTKPMLDLD